MVQRNGVVGFLADMMADIRTKLVEEPWFGREVTPPDAASPTPMEVHLGWTQRMEVHLGLTQRMEVHLGWIQWKDQPAPAPAIDPARAQDRDHGLDR